MKNHLLRSPLLIGPLLILLMGSDCGGPLNTAPIAEAGPNQTVLVGETVTLDGSGSSDQQGDDLSYEWSLISVPGGSEASLTSIREARTNFTADVAGIYEAELLVSDGQLSTIDRVTITAREANEPPPSENPPPSSTLDCERENYPCSLADVPEPVLQATQDALQGAFDARKNGGMNAARAYLEARPDIIEVVGDERALRFRLEGGAPAWFIDRSNLGLAPSTTSFSSIHDVPVELHDLNDLTPQAVVGEDRNQDGKVNNRDERKALVLAPYLWQFAPYDESPLLAERLNLIPGYEGNVTYKGNPNEDDANVTLDDYGSWDEYDAIFVSTHGVRACWPRGDTRKCGIVVSSGVRWNVNDVSVATGAIMSGMYDDEAGTSNLFLELGLTLDFFRTAYSGGFDNTLVSFSACETGAAGASELADAIGGEDFVMMGWTEVVDSDDAFNALGLFEEKLAQGLSAERALEAVQQAGLSPVPNSDGVMTAFTRFAPAGGDQRIREVVTLFDIHGEPLADDSPLETYLIGNMGDGQDDMLTLSARVDGVAEGLEGYKLHFELDGDPIGVRYPLGNPPPKVTISEADEYAFYVGLPELPLNLDVESGRSYTLEAILDLPEGGSSRYEVILKEGGCHWTMAVSGTPRAGDYSGDDALFNHEPNGGLSLTLNGPAVTGVGAHVFSAVRVGEFALGGDAADGYASVGFSDAGVIYPPVLMTDNDATATLSLTVNDEEWMEGTIAGTFWGFSLGTPAQRLEAGVVVEFRAQNFRDADGNINFTACHGN